MSNPPPPDDLEERGRGRAFWRKVHKTFDLEVDERELLAETCRVLDQIERLRPVAGQATFLKGSTGQFVVNPAIRELRAQRALLGRLLSQLGVPGEGKREVEEGKGVVSLGSVRARRAARARWDRKRGGGAAPVEAED